MRPHGDYKIEVLDNIVHIFPFGGFNSEGIAELHNEIVLHAPQSPWALFEHPYNTAGLTPDAIDAIIHSYRNLEKHNCVAIALELSSTWQRVFETSIVEHISIPMYLGNNRDILEHKVLKKLSGSR